MPCLSVKVLRAQASPPRVSARASPVLDFVIEVWFLIQVCKEGSWSDLHINLAPIGHSSFAVPMSFTSDNHFH